MGPNRETPGTRVPAVFAPYGAHVTLVRAVHDLNTRGRYAEALALAEHAQAVLWMLGDPQSALAVEQGRMYALMSLGDLGEALQASQALARRRQSASPRADQAKAVADAAELLIILGRLDEGLQLLARATYLLERTPHSGMRYFSALSSVADAARAAELYELADECARAATGTLAVDELFRSMGQLQHAEMLLEWGIRLEQVGLLHAGQQQLTRGVTILRDQVGRHPDGPLGRALLALGCARTGQVGEAVTIVERDLMAMRAAGQHHEARVLHLAYGSALQHLGRPTEAFREFSAALELAELTGRRLLIGNELAELAATMAGGNATRTMLAALREQLKHLWRLRSDRLLALQQTRRRTQLENDWQRANDMATSDALTGLANRRVLDQRLTGRKRGGVLILIDVDRFKSINDTYSHSVGDHVLRSVAELLRAQCRQGEVAIRFGGDEFAMFLDTDLHTAAKVAERIRRAIVRTRWDEVAPGLRVTLSIGLAQGSADMTGQDLFDLADQRLYDAKRHGRNRLAA